MSSAGISQGVLDAMQTMRQNQTDDQIKQLRQLQIQQAQRQAADVAAQSGFVPPSFLGGQPPAPQLPPSAMPPQTPQPSMPPQSAQPPRPPMQPPQPAPAPAPGQASVPMTHPSPIPPYQTVGGMQQRPPMPPQQAAPPQPQAPQSPQQMPGMGVPAIDQLMQSPEYKSTPPDQRLNYIKAMLPLAERLDSERQRQFEMLQAANKAAMLEQDRVLRAEHEQELVKHWANMDAAAKKRAIAAGEKPPSAGNFNVFASRETAEIKPIALAQQQSQEIRGMLATDNPASSVQLQKLLTMYLQSGRQTNLTYMGNKGFGSYPERLKNTISRIFSGNYSEVNKQDILDLVNQMDKTVFNPARTKVVEKYKKQAKIMHIDPSFADNPNTFDTGTIPATSSDTGGWKVEKVQ